MFVENEGQVGVDGGLDVGEGSVVSSSGKGDCVVESVSWGVRGSGVAKGVVTMLFAESLSRTGKSRSLAGERSRVVSG
jgi:hypothetical protein